MSDTPERFLDEVAYLLDPAETGTHGCLIPLLDDEPEDGEEEGDE